MRLIASLVLFATLITGSPPAIAAIAPRLAVTSFEQLAKPLPLPYDTSANADQAVAAATRRARRSGRLLLIDLGGNWCLDCRLLAGTMDVPALRSWLARRYEIVTVDVGRFDKNMHMFARFGAPGRPAGVPALLIVDPRSRRLINQGRITALADARTMTPQGIADWLAQWVR